jgi:hypothetical protein
MAAGRFKGRWGEHADALMEGLLDCGWKSASLPPWNVFTTAFILESVTLLEKNGAKLIKENELDRAEQVLGEALADSDKAGAVSLKIEVDGKKVVYPPSAYLTQLAIRVLRRRGKLDQELEKYSKRWAFNEITRQITLRISGDSNTDVFSLAYAAIILSPVSPSDRLTPEETRVLRTAIDSLFDAQNKEDGSWPLSRPIFHYPEYGNAYCYEYEMLAQLLQQENLQPYLLAHLDGLSAAAKALDSTYYPLSGGGRGWASGHHPSLKGPESWSTASVYHFVHALGRLVAEAVRRKLFEKLDQEYTPPSPLRADKEFARDFLDSRIEVDGEKESLRETILKRFVDPLKDNVNVVAAGQPIPRDTKMSAILFGPPGTSKTTLASQIASYLGWPRLTVDPSHLVRKGMDFIQAEANAIFDMLAATECVVVLFDEFDEMVRDRSSPEVLSRFLTTAMLPKLSKIHELRRIVFILATKQIDQFDLAISRLGRFDRIFQVMPPTLDAKLRHEPWKDVAKKLADFKIDVERLREKLDSLTYHEFDSLVPKLLKAESPQVFIEAVDLATAGSTLERKIDGQDQTSQTWKDKCESQSKFIRID